MLRAVRAFKQNNPAWTDVKVVVIDKCFTELKLLQEEFPCASVILCHFHVIDYLKREVSKKNYGFSAFEKMHIKSIMMVVVRAEYESLFESYVSALKKLRAGKPPFLDYFTDNWLNCKEHEGLAEPALAMDECIDHLLLLQQSTEDQYTVKIKRVGFRLNQNYDK
ncbi:hypothetical protein PC128_g24464 [Phytophthora cactorum]|nr:hypothetical protein PC128_g24464 [Phytophthora cactorum]